MMSDPGSSEQPVVQAFRSHTSPIASHGRDACAADDVDLSYIILTHNRRAALLETLARIGDDAASEIIVVDNASTDGTAGAVRTAFPQVRVIQRPVNEGSAARNIGAAAASGRHLMFLDDDSFPIGATAARCIAHLDRSPGVALIGGRVVLPDGGEDASALPLVMPACAMCVRRSAFLDVGGFAPEFFRQAEEYDLTFRLLAAGWRVRRCDDLLFHHEKVAAGRSSELIVRMDLRNNLILAERYLPRDLRRVYRADWLRRYAALAEHAGHGASVAAAVADARQWAARERAAGRRVLPPHLLEAVFQIRRQQRAVAAWAREHRVRRVVIADCSKNLYATWRSCRAAGVEVIAIADSHPAFVNGHYRGVPVMTDLHAARESPDGVVLSTVNPARVQRRASALARRFGWPILTLWAPAIHVKQQAAMGKKTPGATRMGAL